MDPGAEHVVPLDGKLPTEVEAEILLEGIAVLARFDIKSGEFSWQPSPVHKSGSGFGLLSGLEKTGSLALVDDLLGFHLGASTVMLRMFPKAPRAGCSPCGMARRQKDYLLDFRSHEDHAAWAEALDTWLANSGRPRRLLVIVNPMSGKGKAREVYLRQVLPLLESAAISVTMLETNYHRHAIDIARGLNLNLYDGIACVSGDGILSEVVNGFLQRPDWQRAIDVPLGHIIAGSGNGMAKSALSYGDEDACNVVNTTFAIVAGKRSNLDVLTVSQGEKAFHGVLGMGWGMVSDVDVESEKYRWMGGARLTFQTLVRTMALRRYQGTLTYLPASSEFLTHGEGAVDPTVGSQGQFLGPPMQELEQLTGWQTIEGEFTLVWGQNVPWAATDMYAAPRAQLCDGCLDLIVLKTCSPVQLLSLFLDIEKGKHLNHTLVEYLKVRALKLLPGKRTKGKVPGGILTVDGEVVARGVGAVGDRNQDLMDYDEQFDFTVSQGLLQLFVA